MYVAAYMLLSLGKEIWDGKAPGDESDEEEKTLRGRTIYEHGAVQLSRSNVIFYCSPVLAVMITDC